jgi:nucleotide sugar dehydrogenase
MKIGIIGNGFVGSAISSGFIHYVNDLKVFDKDPNRSANTLKECVEQDIVFVCLPTPMLLAENGKCDLSIIESSFGEVNELGSSSIFVIKSTVPVGTTLSLQEKFPKLKILHSPEFLTARTALLDFITPSRNIVGFPKGFYSNLHGVPAQLVSLYESRFPGIKTFLMDSDSTEMIKYIANCFFATKVSYFNEVKLLCDKMEIDFNKVMEGVLSDGRIGVSHFQAPGHDGKFGFGGTCFPKDINSFINLMIDNDIEPNVLKGAWQTNLNVRPEKDWENSSSAVTKSTSKESGDLSGCGHDHT